MILDRCMTLLAAVLTVNLAKGLVVFVVAYAATALLKNLSSEYKHLIWFVVICSFVLLPLAWLALPAIRVGLQIPMESAAAYRLAAASVISRHEYAQLVDKANEYAALAKQGPPVLLHGLFLALALAWLVGVLILLVRLVGGLRVLKRLETAAEKDRGLQPLVGQLAGESGIKARVAVLCSPRCGIPFTHGILRPAILLPAAALGWPRSRLRSVLTHELAHIRRKDVLTQSLAYAICLVFWFIPLLWMAYAAMLREAEKSCDRYVLNGGIQGTEYARDIVDLARACRGRILLPSISSMIRRKSMLQERIKNVLSLKPCRFSFGMRGAARVLAICLCCIVPILAITCATKPAVVKQDNPFYGTWVNAEYGGKAPDFSAKFVTFSDGRELDYLKIADTTPEWESKNTIEETWIDAEGNHWYKVRGTWDWYPYKVATSKGYGLIRINASGTVWEGVRAEAGYPEEMSPIGGAYSIYHRQE